MINELIIKTEKTEEPNVVLITVTVSQNDLEFYLNNAFIKLRSKYDILGFRQGRAPRYAIERSYGKEVFTEEAVNNLMPVAFNEMKNRIDCDVAVFGEVNYLQVGSGKDLIFTVRAAVKPVVILGQYKGLKYRKEDTTVSEDELTAGIDKDRKSESTTRRVDRPARNGDQIVLDFKGYTDGIPFDGGEAEGYVFEIGSHTFIPGFEEQLIGAEADKPLNVNVIFPEDYHAENLKGKPALFECMIHEVREIVLPEADDDFAKAMGYESLAEYRESVLNELTEKKEKDANDRMEQSLIEMAVANADFHIPEMIAEKYTEENMISFERQLNAQGINLDMYLEYVGKTMETFREEAREAAINQVSGNRVLSAIAEAENFVISQSRVDKAIEDLAADYSMPVDEYRNIIGEEGVAGVANNLKIDDAIALLVSSSVEE